MSIKNTTMREETVDKLKDLAQVNRDSEQGFCKAAELVGDDNRLAQLFKDLETQRQTFANDLERHIPDARETDGSFAGKMHRWWMDLRETLTSDQRYNVLAEAERGEDKIKGMYEEVLKETAGSPVNDVLQRQYVDIKLAHDLIRAMRDSAKDAK